MSKKQKAEFKCLECRETLYREKKCIVPPATPKIKPPGKNPLPKTSTRSSMQSLVIPEFIRGLIDKLTTVPIQISSKLPTSSQTLRGNLDGRTPNVSRDQQVEIEEIIEGENTSSDAQIKFNIPTSNSFGSLNADTMAEPETCSRNRSKQENTIIQEARKHLSDKSMMYVTHRKKRQILSVSGPSCSVSENNLTQQSMPEFPTNIEDNGLIMLKEEIISLKSELLSGDEAIENLIMENSLLTKQLKKYEQIIKMYKTVGFDTSTQTQSLLSPKYKHTGNKDKVTTRTRDNIPAPNSIPHEETSFYQNEHRFVASLPKLPDRTLNPRRNERTAELSLLKPKYRVRVYSDEQEREMRNILQKLLGIL
ncbi:hypothetical protein O0L34_g10906 [Tuta absoluta]|nr:hypothetical protein O0L34_g10906 [Tuta absoluta]